LTVTFAVRYPITALNTKKGKETMALNGRKKGCHKFKKIVTLLI
jgi:hypothetical protein